MSIRPVKRVSQSTPAIEGADESDAERVQRSQHMARVGIWDLKSGQLLLRLRTEAAGQLHDVGRRASQDPASLAARQRQANGCAVALAVKEKISSASAPRPVPEEAGSAP